MTWSPQQQRALDAVAAWLKDPSQQVFRLFGYAGTGKTTLAKHFAEGVRGGVAYGAFTGKAASVMAEKGCHGARTIHSLIYKPRERGKNQVEALEQELTERRAELSEEAREEGLSAEQASALYRNDAQLRRLQRLLAEEREAGAKPLFTLNHESDLRHMALCVVDEVSMVDGDMGADLERFGVKLLVLGDPAQLPPVRGAGYFTEATPDVMLTDIQRQARENPIIDLATRVRCGEALPLGAYGESRVLARADIGPEDAQGADQILVGKNRTRHAVNERLRTLLGLRGEDAYPRTGDKLVCLRNDHEVGLLNGTLWRHEETYGVAGDGHLAMRISNEDGADVCVDVHRHHFDQPDEKIDWWTRKDAQEFDYGYALTVHKSQGSQWGNVLLFDESEVFRGDRDRWLYTGLTRASERVTVAR